MLNADLNESTAAIKKYYFTLFR